MMFAPTAGCPEPHRSLERSADPTEDEGISQLWEIWIPLKYCLNDSKVRLSNEKRVGAWSVQKLSRTSTRQLACRGGTENAPESVN